MKIKVANKKVQDTFYTLVPLNWLLRFFNLSCIYRNGNHLKVSWSLTKSIIYVFVLGFVNFFFLLNKIQRLDVIRKKSTFLTFSDTIQMSYLVGYFEYIIDLYYVFKYGRDDFLKYFKSFENIDRILGMTDYHNIRKTILNTLRFCVIFFIASSIIDYASWIQGFGLISPTLYSLDYFYFFLNMLPVLDGMSHVVQLEYRLKLMKNLLQGYYNSPNPTKSIRDDDKKRISSTEAGNLRLDSLNILSHDRLLEVIGFNRCYLLLLEQTNYINAKFGVRILIFYVNLLINMINLLNLAIRIATGSMQSPNSNSRLPSVSSMIRLINWGVVAIIMVHSCEITYRQSENILEFIDLILINKNNSNNLTTNLVSLRNLLLTRPIKFHATHFFYVEYTLLVSLVSAVVTYTIIMLQSMN